MNTDILFDICIPKHISYRYYNANSEKKCYVSDDKNHTFFEFDGISAELLSLIFNMEKEELLNFIKNNNLEDEADEFLFELYSEGIIEIGNIEKNLKCNNLFSYTSNDFEETKRFEDKMYSWLSKNGFMFRLFIEMTYNCNLSCIHCYNTKHDKRIIKFDEIKKAVDEAYELGIFYVTLSGGECTLDKDFFKIAEYIRSKHISFDILTNGQVLYDNEDLFNKIINLFPYRVSLSLYSMNPEIHDGITGIKGSHYKTLAVINKLREKDILVEIKCFLMKNNAYEYKEIQEYAKKIGVSMSLACLFFNNPEINNKDVQITDEQLLNVYSDKQSLLKAEKIHDIEDKDFLDRRVCSAGYKGLGIAPNLDIYVCSSLKILLGNLKNDSIKQIWRDKNENSPLNKIRKTRKRDMKGCFKEEYCRYCTYCPGMAAFENNYMKKNEDFCRHAKMKLKAAKLIELNND